MKQAENVVQRQPMRYRVGLGNSTCADTAGHGADMPLAGVQAPSTADKTRKPQPLSVSPAARPEPSGTGRSFHEDLNGLFLKCVCILVSHRLWQVPGDAPAPPQEAGQHCTPRPPSGLALTGLPK